MRNQTVFAAVLCTLLAFFAGACSDVTAIAEYPVGPGGSTNTNTVVTATATNQNLFPQCTPSAGSSTSQLEYRVNGSVVTSGVSWVSWNTTVATVTSSGQVTAVNAGSVKFVGQGPNGPVEITLVVNPCPVVPITRVVTSIDYTPPGGTLTVPNGQQLTPACKDQFGDAITCPANLQWTSSENTKVSVTQAGFITCIASGPSEVTVQTPNGGPSNRHSWTCTTATVPVQITGVRITVTPAGNVNSCPTTLTITTEVLTNGGSGTYNTTASLAASIGTLTQVEPNKWTWTATPGMNTNVIFTATANGNSSVQNTLQVTVNCPNIPQAFAVTFNPPSIFPSSCPSAGATTSQATLMNTTANQPVTSAITWTGPSNGAVTVNAQGQVTGVTAGTWQVTGVSGGNTGVGNIVVNACPSTQPNVVVTGPTSFTCVAGETRQVPLIVTASGGATSAGTFSLVSSNPTGAATTLVTWNQPAGTNTLNVNCLGSGTVGIRWTSTSVPLVTHNITGTITSGTVTCVIRVDGQVVTSTTIAVGSSKSAAVECTNQFGVQFLPFWNSTAPSRVEVQGLQSIVRGGMTWWVGFSAQLRRHIAGTATITVQVDITSTTPIAVLTVN